MLDSWLFIIIFFPCVFFAHKLFVVWHRNAAHIRISVSHITCAQVRNADCPHMRLERRARVKSVLFSSSSLCADYYYNLEFHSFAGHAIHLAFVVIFLLLFLLLVYLQKRNRYFNFSFFACPRRTSSSLTQFFILFSCFTVGSLISEFDTNEKKEDAEVSLSPC